MSLDAESLVSSLKEVLNENLLSLIRSGRLSENLLFEYPFKHAVINDFFSKSFLDLIIDGTSKVKLEKAEKRGEAVRSSLFWGPYTEKKVIQTIYGNAFRAFVSKLLGFPVFMSSLTIPQFNRFEPQSGGFLIHNDMNDYNKREIAMLINLSRGYSNGLGGELCFHEDGEEKSVFKLVPPIMNTVVFFEITNRSWHSVTDVKGSWHREMLMFDWYKNRPIDF